MNEHEKYMRRCIELAKQGVGKVAPNPMVGAVIVHNGQIIGESYHQQFGEAHAEVNAINSLNDKSLLPYSTLYVNLEPCSHYGKTPPCALRIIDCRIPRVVIGHNDPFPKVSGGGIKMLQEAGIEVIADVLHNECAELNKRFFTFHHKKRPYIILKWAESADGFIDKWRASASEKPLKISNAETLKSVHQRRAEEAAIMVGTNTALLDNPSLTVRLSAGNNPVRVMIDRDLKIPQHYHLFNHEAQTLVFTARHCGIEPHNVKREIAGQARNGENNIHYINIDFNQNILPQILEELYSRNLLSLIVEGGSFLLNSFINNGLWDEAVVETAPDLFIHEGIKSPILKNNVLIDEKKVENNYIRTFKNSLLA